MQCQGCQNKRHGDIQIVQMFESRLRMPAFHLHYPANPKLHVDGKNPSAQIQNPVQVDVAYTSRRKFVSV
jgi:hypothetical protein